MCMRGKSCATFPLHCIPSSQRNRFPADVNVIQALLFLEGQSERRHLQVKCSPGRHRSEGCKVPYDLQRRASCFMDPKHSSVKE